jgi:hypothetical protein
MKAKCHKESMSTQPGKNKKDQKNDGKMILLTTIRHRFQSEINTLLSRSNMFCKHQRSATF